MSLHQPKRDFNLRRTAARTNRSSDARKPERRLFGHASINDLATETLHQICCYFCLHCGGDLFGSIDDPSSLYTEARRTLLSMCLVSRRLSHVAQQVLFHEYLSGSWFPNRRWIPFARTVLERPDLAQAVRVVTLHSLRSSELFEDKLLPSFVGHMAKKAAESRNVDFCPAWRTRLREDEEWPPEFQTLLESFLDDKRPRRRPPRRIRPDVMQKWMNGEIMTLAIACMPRLEYLGLSNEAASAFHPPAMRAVGVNQLPIKTLDLWYWGPAIVQCATSIETLKLRCVTSLFQIPVLPKLKTLHILGGSIKFPQLERLLTSCTTNLQNFVYKTSVFPEPSHLSAWANYESRDHRVLADENGTELREQYLLKDLIEYLNPHRCTLTTLHIDLSFRFLAMSAMQGIPSLKRFVALKELFINSGTIYSRPRENDQNPVLHEIFPPAIESLYLLDENLLTHNRLQDDLRHLGTLKLQDSTLFPNLRNIVVHIKAPSVPHRYYDVFANTGVNFRTGNFATPPETLYANRILDLPGEHFAIQQTIIPSPTIISSHFYVMQPLPDSDSSDPDL